MQVLTDPVEFENVRDAMRKAGFPPDDAGLTMWAATTTALELDDASSMVKLLEALEDLDDVQNVYSNADIGDDVLSQL
jgi:transcriptional/translational regulatory protein YebC/TACO1